MDLIVHDWSQHGEQAHVLKFFENTPDSPYNKMQFLDLGAFDGLTGSNTRALANQGWSGVCVEANPIYFSKLLSLYLPLWGRVKCVCAAVVPDDQRMVPFYEADGQCGSCVLTPESKRLLKGEFYVGAITPEGLGRKLGHCFDFVSLDIEGLDEPVFKAMGPLLSETKLICFEDYEPGDIHDPAYYQRMLDIAASHGFTRVVARTTIGSEGGNTLVARP
jgi:FkbM family methyltransferase